MKSKNLKAEEKILYYAKQEFMQKGFDDASMRTIAEKRGLRRECCIAVSPIKTNCFPRS